MDGISSPNHPSIHPSTHHTQPLIQGPQSIHQTRLADASQLRQAMWRSFVSQVVKTVEVILESERHAVHRSSINITLPGPAPCATGGLSGARINEDISVIFSRLFFAFWNYFYLFIYLFCIIRASRFFKFWEMIILLYFFFINILIRF